MQLKKLIQQRLSKFFKQRQTSIQTFRLGILFLNFWKYYSQKLFGWILIFAFVGGLVCPIYINATQIDELKSQISEKSLEMKQLEEEIEKWETEIEVIGTKKKSLSNEINYLNTTQKKINSDIYLTSKQINTAGLTIEKLGIEINEKKQNIQTSSAALSETLKTINEQETTTFLETLLTYNTLSEFWNDMEGLQKVQAQIKNKTRILKDLKAGMISDKEELEQRKNELSSHQVELTDKKEIVENTKKTTNELLVDTKNKESNYQEILDEKLALKKAFENELREYEDKLRLIVDPTSIPDAGFSVLSWPLDKIYITQFFGNTPFATKNPQIYASGEHNGVDFRASIGTDLKTVLSGTVVATGDTDIACKGASYGKWVLIRHNNGLSTVYGHMSKISVEPGQILVTGDKIGYTGNTGASTGPHLHFGVFATQGVAVKEYNFNSCKGKSTTMPMATKDAYLNPMSYLPEYK
ncbi:MAG: peptidoglycan DD-metalloendopeptidase family protein [Patescibacteria group bacterium]